MQRGYVLHKQDDEILINSMSIEFKGVQSLFLKTLIEIMKIR